MTRPRSSGSADGSPTPVQEALQLTPGQFQFPFAMMVTPQLLPLPLGLAISTWLLGQLALMFQVALIRAGLGTFIVTVHEDEPLTETLRLYRSPHDWPAESVAVQLPPPGVVVVVVGVVVGVVVSVGVVVGVVVGPGPAALRAFSTEL